MRPRVLCTALGAETGPHFEILRNGGFDPVVVDRTVSLWDEDTLIRMLDGAVAVLAGSEPYSRRVLASSPSLKVIARMGVGYDAVDVIACDELGVIITTTPGVNHDSVAEHTFALLMGVARDFPRQDMAVRRGKWVRQALPRVQGSTLGIVGLGRIGRAVAWRAVGLGMKVLAFEPNPDQAFCEKWGIKVVSLDELLSQSDYVSLHCPSTPQSRHLINADRLAMMKAGSVLINTARGPLVDEAALIEALKSGHVRAAGLDVFEKEPLPTSSPLIGMENVLLAGHTAGLDQESHRDTYAMGAETIVTFAHGGRPAAECIQNCCDTTNWTWSAGRK
ncbi:MAG: phosphoglycerate dehydrogenase [Planctomycetota bacterium]|nr:phosphoglycerate dehydrogenase [Planctomycetaceae bacterium]MDQ3329901.1 phosphoglycerate dehydrogenase [Planctomycetota bacterium]